MTEQADGSAVRLHLLRSPILQRLMFRYAGAVSSVHAMTAMFVLFSNRLGCLGSIVVSIVGTLLLVLLLRACAGVPSGW